MDFYGKLQFCPRICLSDCIRERGKGRIEQGLEWNLWQRVGLCSEKVFTVQKNLTRHESREPEQDNREHQWGQNVVTE